MHVVPASFDPELIKRELSQNSKAKNHMVITTNTEKVFDKIQHSFMIKNRKTTTKKTSSENGHRRHLPRHNKCHIWQTHSKHYCQQWKTKNIPFKMRKKSKHDSIHQYSPLFNIVFTSIIQHSPLLFKIILEALPMQWEKKTK